MRVLIIGSVFSRSESDDQVPWLRETCRRLKENGIDVEVLAPSSRGMKSHKIDGVVVHRFRYAPAKWETLTGEEGAPSKLRRNPLLKFLAVAYLWSGFWFLFGLLLKNNWGKKKFDLVEVHWPFPHAFMALPAVFFGVPMIYHYHSAELKLAAQSKLSNFFFAQSLSWARAHVANSSYTASLVKKLNAKLKVEIIAYGAPIKFLGSKGLSALGAEHEAGKRPCKNLLFVGRHIERKGIRYLIEAMKLLSEEFTLTIVGEGDLTEKLKEQTRNEKVDARVIFAGRLSSEELTKAYQTHDVFVLPAIVDTKGDTEGLGVVLIEAIAVGLPIVATNVGGIVDVIIDGETGMLVEEKNPQALAEAIKKMSADEILAQKLITGARKRAAEFFSWDKVLEKTIEVYKEASNKS